MTNGRRARATRSSDPRKLPGEITGPGGPHDRGAFILDATRAVLLDSVVASTVDSEQAETGSAIALLLEGRINRTTERARVLFIFGTDGAAAIVTELVALLGRASSKPGFGAQLMADLIERAKALHEAGHDDTAPTGAPDAAAP